MIERLRQPRAGGTSAVCTERVKRFGIRPPWQAHDKINLGRTKTPAVLATPRLVTLLRTYGAIFSPLPFPSLRSINRCPSPLATVKLQFNLRLQTTGTPDAKSALGGDNQRGGACDHF